MSPYSRIRMFHWQLFTHKHVLLNFLAVTVAIYFGDFVTSYLQLYVGSSMLPYPTTFPKSFRNKDTNLFDTGKFNAGGNPVMD